MVAVSPDENILAIILMFHITNGIIKEFIRILADISNRNKLGGAIAIIVISILILLAAMVVIVLYITITYRRIKRKNHRSSFCTAGIFQFLGVLLYYCGSNISYIILMYGDILGCTDNCSNAVQYVATFLLGMAIILYSIIAAVFSHNRKFIKFNNRHLLLNSKALLTMIVQLDAVYKTALISFSGVDTTKVCSETAVIITSLFLCVCTFVGFVLITISMAEEYWINGKCAIGIFFQTVPLFFLATIFMIVPFLLADNVLPLQCGFKFNNCGNDTMTPSFKCNYVADNGTSMFMNQTGFVNEADTRTESSVRLGLFGCCLVTYLAILFNK